MVGVASERVIDTQEDSTTAFYKSLKYGPELSVRVHRNKITSADGRLAAATFNYSLGGLNFKSSLEYSETFGGSPTDYNIFIARATRPKEKVAYLKYDLVRNRPSHIALETTPHRSFDVLPYGDSFSTLDEVEGLRVFDVGEQFSSKLDGNVVINRLLNAKDQLIGEMQVLTGGNGVFPERELVFPGSLDVALLDYCARVRWDGFWRIVSDPSIFIEIFQDNCYKECKNLFFN